MRSHANWMFDRVYREDPPILEEGLDRISPQTASSHPARGTMGAMVVVNEMGKGPATVTKLTSGESRRSLMDAKSNTQR